MGMKQEKTVHNYQKLQTPATNYLPSPKKFGIILHFHSFKKRTEIFEFCQFAGVLWNGSCLPALKTAA